MSHPAVIGHRGAAGRFAENTVAAFEGARLLGADWVELDVRRTADGVLAVHHDERLADGRAIAELLASELPAHVPDLREALLASAGMGVNVEVKPHDDLRVADAVVAVVRAFDGEVLLSSFQPELVGRVREIADDVPTALLVYVDPAGAIDVCAAVGHRALHPWDPTVDAELVEQCHGAGLAVNVWTVDDPDRMRELAAIGVDGIVTNVPDVARAVLDATGPG
jgi:glycerophosphoryl diester phosphodiesterase